MTTPAKDHQEAEITLGELVVVLLAAWRKLLATSFSIGLAVLLLMFTRPNYYRASAIISPTGDEKKPLGALGALAAVGLDLGGPAKIEDLESLFRSHDLTALVFSRHNIWSEVLGDRYDPHTQRIRSGIFDRLSRTAESGPPNDWDAIRCAEKYLGTLASKKAGTLTISFESFSATGATQIIDYYLDEAKNHLQDDALKRAQRNKKFLENQIAITTDALARDRLFVLLGQEIEKEMMARNREEFAFRIIDSPRVPDRKAGPKRLLIALAAAIGALLASSWVAIARSRTHQHRRQSSPPAILSSGNL